MSPYPQNNAWWIGGQVGDLIAAIIKRMVRRSTRTPRQIQAQQGQQQRSYQMRQRTAHVHPRRRRP